MDALDARREAYSGEDSLSWLLRALRPVAYKFKRGADREKHYKTDMKIK